VAMSTILEVDETGTLHLPARILPQAAPHTRYIASAHGQQVILAPADLQKAFWQTASPEERAADILKWAASHSSGPNLPDSAVSRDGIYD
jgi:hypothetical protein